MKVVLGYSGSLETSAAIRLLAARPGTTVVALVLDLGQDRDLQQLRTQATSLGAVRAHVLDTREEFARDCILPTLHAVHSDVHDPLATIEHIAHPLLARKLVEIAGIEQTTVVAHGGSREEHVSIEAAVATISGGITVLAPIADAGMDRDQLIAFARANGIAVPSAARRSPMRMPDIPAHVEVQFEQGVPVSVNGVPMSLTELIESLSVIAVNHGIARGNVAESHTMYEAPAAVVLGEAHDALAGGGHARPTGTVRLKLFRGEHTVVGHSPVAVN